MQLTMKFIPGTTGNVDYTIKVINCVLISKLNVLGKLFIGKKTQAAKKNYSHKHTYALNED